MIEKIKNLYCVLDVLHQKVENRRFYIYTLVDNCKLSTSVDCAKYAKFITNEFKYLVNNYGDEIYNDLDPLKIKALFAISEEYSWFSRKELMEFIMYEIQTNKKIPQDKTLNM